MFWNRPGRRTDYWSVDCDDIRETLSARLDGEAGPTHAERLADEHLEHCGACARWLDGAAAVTRRIRVSAATAWPDVTGAVLARVPPAPHTGRPRPRPALGVMGAAQCAAGLILLAAHSATTFETGAWRVALGVALTTAAIRRTPTTPLIPLLGTVLAVLAVRYLTGSEPLGWPAIAHALDAAAFALLLTPHRRRTRSNSL
ncbi:zf-HC2 domain-containing protein [Saccharothrix sp.]|uniref:zf-HC2 domain-containing protein n=1 Tax=Saccharothrix sp. TaxID=1873460 RepID=UPI00281194F5|nr:zf-HC2 domain-containing protein [Saccharothrix sp.]